MSGTGRWRAKSTVRVQGRGGRGSDESQFCGRASVRVRGCMRSSHHLGCTGRGSQTRRRSRRRMPLRVCPTHRQTLFGRAGMMTVYVLSFSALTLRLLAMDGSQTPPRMSRACESSWHSILCGFVCLPCSTLSHRRPHLHITGLIAVAHGDGGWRTQSPKGTTRTWPTIAVIV